MAPIKRNVSIVKSQNPLLIVSGGNMVNAPVIMTTNVNPSKKAPIDIKSVIKLEPQSEFIITNKKQRLVPLSESTLNNIMVTTTNTVPVTTMASTSLSAGPSIPNKVTKVKTSNSRATSTSAKIQAGQMSVARRNERERKRVKQVNEAYARLRSHIPEEIAHSFDSQNGGRSSSKKLSKVDTLRMTINYVSYLYNIVNPDNVDDIPNMDLSIASDDQTYSSMISTPSPEHPYPETQLSGQSQLESLPPPFVVIGNNVYKHIPGTENYQQCSTTELIGQNDENFQPGADRITAMVPNNFMVDSSEYLSTTFEVITPESPSDYVEQSSPLLTDTTIESYYDPMQQLSNEQNVENGIVYLGTDGQAYTGIITFKKEEIDDNAFGVDGRLGQTVTTMDW